MKFQIKYPFVIQIVWLRTTSHIGRHWQNILPQFTIVVKTLNNRHNQAKTRLPG
jgi:hypothetical protein